jgi:hypothetical protein
MKDYQNCLILLCLNLWSIMKNFYETLLIHSNYLDEIDNNGTSFKESN